MRLREHRMPCVRLIVRVAKSGLERSEERQHGGARLYAAAVRLLPHRVEEKVCGVLRLDQEASRYGRLGHHAKVQRSYSVVRAHPANAALSGRRTRDRA